MDRFSLKPQFWYAAELIGKEFGPEIRSYSPLRVDRIIPRGRRRFSLSFYHAYYPEGVREKVYELETLERNEHFILARSSSHEPPRLILIHGITSDWLARHFGVSIPEHLDVQTWLARNA